ncbi:MAG: hypothetical protein AB7V18_09905 [Pyrinomonadaceae bacterium]
MRGNNQFSVTASLVRALESNLRSFRLARSEAERKCCLKRIRKLEVRLGKEVVTAVSIAVARGRDMEFEIFQGLCASKQLTAPTSWIQQMYLGNGIGVCPMCGAIVLRDDTDHSRPDSASGEAP